ncbi:MAG: hypothetical protein C5B58_11280 [Acidobacteria bacterium]|nr:MAG: hypothetical protein C5B58_11280 [Acidobacteriota bacterium]
MAIKQRSIAPGHLASEISRLRNLRLICYFIEKEIGVAIGLWIKNPEGLLEETFFHQVVFGILPHNGIEILFFPEQVTGPAIDMNHARCLGFHG